MIAAAKMAVLHAVATKRDPPETIHGSPGRRLSQSMPHLLEWKYGNASVRDCEWMRRTVFGRDKRDPPKVLPFAIGGGALGITRPAILVMRDA